MTKNRFPLSAMGFGLAFMLSFHDIWAMFLGSLVFGVLEHRRKIWEKVQEKRGEISAALAGDKPWYVIASENTDTICGGVIAGGALMGIAVNVLDLLVLPEIKEARALAPLVRHAIGALR